MFTIHNIVLHARPINISVKSQKQLLEGRYLVYINIYTLITLLQSQKWMEKSGFFLCYLLNFGRSD